MLASKSLASQILAGLVGGLVVLSLWLAFVTVAEVFGWL